MSHPPRYYGENDLHFLTTSVCRRTPRLASTPSRGVYYDGAYAPYGESYAESGTTDHSFTGQEQDVAPSGQYPLYDFLAREYNPTWGRWISPDPAGLSAADPANPQSWNMYAYVNNNPLSIADPMGLESCTVQSASQVNCPPTKVTVNGGTPPKVNPFSLEWLYNEFPGSGVCIPSIGSFCQYSTYWTGGGPVTPSGGHGGSAAGQSPLPTRSNQAEKQCEQDANARAQDAIWQTYSEVLPELGKTTLEGAVGGAIAGCLVTFEGGCVEGAVPGALTGATGGLIRGGYTGLRNMYTTDTRAMKQLYHDLAACEGGS